MREFHEADAHQRKKRDEILVPLFYEEKFKGRYRFLSWDDPLQAQGVDTIVTAKDGIEIKVEEKIVGWPDRKNKYTAMTLETWSCTVPGREKRGWMEYSVADFLLYCFLQPAREIAADCYLIDMQQLKQWFWVVGEDRWAKTVTDQINRTECRVVPIRDIKDAGIKLNR